MPLPTIAGDALGNRHQCLARDITEQDDHLRLGQRNMPGDEGQADIDLAL